MIGRVDEFGRALIRLQLQPSGADDPIAVEAWGDTAFNGELVLPRTILNRRE